MPVRVSIKNQQGGSKPTFVTATWKVTSVIGAGVLLEMLDLISIGGTPGGPLATRENSQATSISVLTSVMLAAEGSEEAKSHSSSWVVFVLEVTGTGFCGGLAAKELIDC
jgi:hypothetical protein